MNISDVKDLMSQFDGSTLREFSFKTGDGELAFSKNEQSFSKVAPIEVQPNVASNPVAEIQVASADTPVISGNSPETSNTPEVVEGDEVTSPLVGVVYLSSAPDKPAFISVGDTVKKGQTLLIIEAMKVMNEIPASKDGIITEIMVANEDIVEFGQGLVRIK